MDNYLIGDFMVLHNHKKFNWYLMKNNETMQSYMLAIDPYCQCPDCMSGVNMLNFAVFFSENLGQSLPNILIESTVLLIFKIA